MQHMPHDTCSVRVGIWPEIAIKLIISSYFVLLKSVCIAWFRLEGKINYSAEIMSAITL